MRTILILVPVCFGLAACAPEGRQRSLETRSLDSGVTSSSGGGQSVLHNQPNVGITNGDATVTGIRNKPTP